ncbi:MAG: hypothetical protein MI674_05040, partial [Cytophagales bacterium]|nr:hypothetical protein [Cytophagales bacterium]
MSRTVLKAVELQANMDKCGISNCTILLPTVVADATDFAVHSKAQTGGVERVLLTSSPLIITLLTIALLTG